MDIDKDGKLDILAGAYGHDVCWAKNLGNGKVGKPVRLKTVTGSPINSKRTWCMYPYAVDFDNDGDLDLLIGTRNGIILYVENIKGGPNGYSSESKILTKIDDNKVKTIFEDYDGDGKKELLCSGHKGIIYIYKNKGTLKAPDFFKFEELKLPELPPKMKNGKVELWSTVLVRSDYNGDGKKDLIVGSYTMETTPEMVEAEKELNEAYKQHKDDKEFLKSDPDFLKLREKYKTLTENKYSQGIWVYLSDKSTE